MILPLKSQSTHKIPVKLPLALVIEAQLRCPLRCSCRVIQLHLQVDLKLGAAVGAIRWIWCLEHFLSIGFCWGLWRWRHVKNYRSETDRFGLFPICSMVLVYLPTFGWFLGQMLVNIPYMEHLGLDGTLMLFFRFRFGKGNCDRLIFLHGADHGQGGRPDHQLLSCTTDGPSYTYGSLHLLGVLYNT